MSSASIYLDHAANSPLRPEVLRAMQPWFGAGGNPSSIHRYGRTLSEQISQSRLLVARTLEVKPEEIVFTAGGTESCNLAMLGTAQAWLRLYGQPGHMIISSVEHAAIEKTAQFLETQGWRITRLHTDETGRIYPTDLESVIQPDTALCSIMLANNELGTIQPLAKCGSYIRKLNQARRLANLPPVRFHSDACQGGGVIDLKPGKHSLDLLTLNGSKLGGPIGTGCLYVRHGVLLDPVQYGGGQEQGRRSGTENTAMITGFATAVHLAQTQRDKSLLHLVQLWEFAKFELFKTFPEAQLLGPELMTKKHQLQRVPYIFTFRIPGVSGEVAQIYLDQAGFAIGTGSACSANDTEHSLVATSIGLDATASQEVIRLSFGQATKTSDIRKLFQELKRLFPLIVQI